MRFPLASLLCLAVVTSAICRDDLDLPANTIELFGSNERIAVLAKTDIVAVCLLQPTSGNWSPPPRSLADYQESESKMVSASQLTQLLLDDSTYEWSKKHLPDGSIRISKKGCLPVYHIRAKFQHATRRVEVNFCLGCLDALVVEEGEIVNASSLSMSGAGKLLKVFLEIFPEDSNLNQSKKFYKLQ